MYNTFIGFCRRIRGSICWFDLPHAYAWGYMLPPLRGFSAALKTANAVKACSHRRQPVVKAEQKENRECGDRNWNKPNPNLSGQKRGLTKTDGINEHAYTMRLLQNSL
jgi:hypothetical protein